MFWSSESNLISVFRGAIYVILCYDWLQPRVEEENTLFIKGHEMYR
jgi:hypothetical protein